MIGVILIILFFISLTLMILSSNENTKVSNDKLEKAIKKHLDK